MPKSQLVQAPPNRPGRPPFRWPLICAASALAVFLLLLSSGAADVRRILRLPPLPPHTNNHVTPAPAPAAAAALEACAWPALEPHVPLLDVPPISRSDFLTRQRVLARALRAAGVDAFVAEPSASTTYYANISARFGLSERPYLMVFSSQDDDDDDDDGDNDGGRFSYLVPQFETGRLNAASQHMVFEGDIDADAAIPWREEQDPYAVLLESGRLGGGGGGVGGDGGGGRTKRKRKVMIDEHARHMVAAGLQAVGVDVVPMSADVRRLRAVKTDAEVAIMRGINAFTRHLVRALQGCLRAGLRQADVVDAGRALFARAGVAGEGYWAIALFGSRAAYPHGGEGGDAAVLRDGEFVLLDIGSSLHGYGSDVTRTMLPPARGGNGAAAAAAVREELMDVWRVVRRAQSAGLAGTRPGAACRDADAASRAPVEAAGYGPYYTHRLGHGLGLETHEHPYLNGANYEKLRPGMVVTNEPGIYVTDEQATKLGLSAGFGVRLEDPILVTEDGGVPLTGRRAESPWDL